MFQLKRKTDSGAVSWLVKKKLLSTLKNINSFKLQYSVYSLDLLSVFSNLISKIMMFSLEKNIFDKKVYEIY